MCQGLRKNPVRWVYICTALYGLYIFQYWKLNCGCPLLFNNGAQVKKNEFLLNFAHFQTLGSYNFETSKKVKIDSVDMVKAKT